MPNTTILISLTDLKQWTQLSQHIELARVKPYILLAQSGHLRPILGKTLYDLIITQSGANTLSYANAALLEEIKPYLSFKAAELYLPMSGVMFQQKGALQPTDDHAEHVSDKKLTAIQQRFAQAAETYRGELINFLTTNKTDYPTWDSNCTTSGTFTSRITSIQRPRRKRYNNKE